MFSYGFSFCVVDELSIVLDCNSDVSEIEFNRCNSLHIRTNTLGKDRNPPGITAAFYKAGFSIEKPLDGWYAIKKETELNLSGWILKLYDRLSYAYFIIFSISL